MRLGLNGATIMHTDLITELEIANRAGFDFAELRDAKLRPYLQDHSMAELLDFLKTVRIKPLNINALEPVTFLSAKEWEELEQRAEWFCSTAAQLGCDTIAVVPGVRPKGATREDCFQESAKALKRLAPIAENYGVGMSFEFIGFDGFAIQGVAECLRVIEAVGRPRIGMVFDFIHFFTGEYVLEELEATDPAMIDMVHLCDAKELPIEVHREHDGKRLLPGDGIMDTDEFMTALSDIGYDGAFSVEIFNEDIWDLDPTQVANDAYRKSRAILDKYYA